MQNIYIPKNKYNLLFSRLFGTSFFTFNLLSILKNNGDTQATLFIDELEKELFNAHISKDHRFKHFTITFKPHSQDNSEIKDITTIESPTIQESKFHVNTITDIEILRKKITYRIAQNCPGIIARKINKKISIPFSLMLSRTSITPTMITVFGLLLSALGGAMLVCGNFLAGCILIQINSILDGCDGEVARMNHLQSEFGRKLDIFGDYSTTGVLIFGEVIGFSLLPSNVLFGTSITILILISLIGVVILIPLAMYFNLLHADVADLEDVTHDFILSGKTIGHIILKIILFISKRDSFIFVSMILALFPNPYILHMFLGLVSLCCIFMAGLSIYLSYNLKQKNII